MKLRSGKDVSIDLTLSDNQDEYHEGDNSSPAPMDIEPLAVLPAPEFKNFKNFEATTDPSDHFYFDHDLGFKDAGISDDLIRRIMHELKMLEANLPDSIYVRVYQDNSTLFRAVIIGASGTPYHDGLFFFDIALPSNYPQVPPLVSFHSRGLFLNPNLYPNGNVCLSLLNTWVGFPEERWNPDQSTLLQVLVSIQGLVLNAEPYFNEAGRDRTKKSIRNEAAKYNLNTFMDCCKYMRILLQCPPKGFEEFVVVYFRERGAKISAACKAYMSGEVSVGQYLQNENQCTSSSSANPTKIAFKSFKRSMVDVHRDLVKAFQMVGACYEETGKRKRVMDGDSHEVGSIVQEEKKTKRNEEESGEFSATRPN